jgi:hypothetical protein
MCITLFTIAAKRMAQHSTIIMILITLNAKGCFAFLDFLIIAIFTMENE